MLAPLHTLARCVADAQRSVGVVVPGVQAYARFYVGYWFSHWRL